MRITHITEALGLVLYLTLGAVALALFAVIAVDYPEKVTLEYTILIALDATIEAYFLFLILNALRRKHSKADENRSLFSFP